MVTIKTFLNECSEKAKQHQELLILIAVVGAFIIILLVLTFAFLLIFPMWQVSRFGLNNVTLEATFENQYRTTLTQIIATFAQILGGGAVAIGIYFAWGNLTTARDGQITERFTRAVDQLGNKKMEIRLGGIYGLERIANESDKDYWSIMEILTAYVRNNSSISYSKDVSLKNVPISMDIQANESTKHEVPKIRTTSLDIQAILTLIARRKYFYGHGETKELNFQETNLQQTNLLMANLSGANLSGANLSGADLSKAYLSGADLSKAYLFKAYLSGADLSKAYLSGADLSWADLSKAYLSGADLSKANLSGANLSGAKNITIDQLSKVKTLYNAKLDDVLLIPLKEKHPELFEKPE